MEENYLRLIELISKSSGVSIEEIERKIAAKQAKLSGLISKEGAAQVIAAELGVNLDKQRIKICQIVPGMKKINIIGKIINLNPIKEFNKNGRSGRIGSFNLADDTSLIRVVLWDENHISLIETGKISEGASIEINNANLRNGEVHLTSFSEINSSDKIFNSIVTKRPVSFKKISEFNQNDNVSTRAFIVNIFEPRFFEVCPDCKRKVSELGECSIHKRVIPEKRALLNFILDDGSESIRAVMFSEQLEKIIKFNELQNPELLSVKKKDFLGKELIVSGQVRRNNMFNNIEFIISDTKEVDWDELIKELER